MGLASHLRQDLYEPKAEREANRVGFGKGLKEAGEKDERIVALSADLTESTRVIEFTEAFPDRFIEIGVAEQNMASVAAGMAVMGKIPFIASYAMFSPGRNWEQIRTTIAYNNVPVKIVGAHAGISVGPDGATHQAIEDVAITRVIPGMTVIVPSDAEEARKATLAAAAHDGPVYIRLAREKTALVTTADSPFAIGKAEVYYEPSSKKRIGIIASGPVVHNALVAAKALDERGIGVSVMNLATIKPLDTDAIRAFAEAHEALVTVEEHQIAGGMGSAIAEYLATVHPTRIAFVGVHDQFGQSGTIEELWKHYNLDAAAIERAVEALVA